MEGELKTKMVEKVVLGSVTIGIPVSAMQLYLNCKVLFDVAMSRIRMGFRDKVLMTSCLGQSYISLK